MHFNEIWHIFKIHSYHTSLELETYSLLHKYMFSSCITEMFLHQHFIVCDISDCVTLSNFFYYVLLISITYKQHWLIFSICGTTFWWVKAEARKADMSEFQFNSIFRDRNILKRLVSAMHFAHVSSWWLFDNRHMIIYCDLPCATQNGQEAHILASTLSSGPHNGMTQVNLYPHCCYQRL